MRKIILASGSKARRRLLRQIGLRFQAVESGVNESRSLKGGPARFVIRNALKKARHVAKRFHSGVVIAADTVVLANKRIIGKPRNVKDALRTIKILSRKPRWVYTGLAVIDIDNRRTYTDYEKTKVYMYPLSEKEITSYFRKVYSLDKAGGFDIQGLGGIFIDRIEGCFYNVVGLPLAKLAKMLKKVGVRILS